MATLTGVQMGRYLIGAGFPSDKLARMIAIGYAESGGDTTATSTAPDGSHGYGWLQIEDSHASEFPGFFPPSTTWQDPGSNAAAGKKVYDSQGINAWTSNSNGAADSHQAEANRDMLAAVALGGLSVGSLVGGAQDVANDNPLSNAAAAITNATKEPLALLDWLKRPGTVMRFAKFGIGLVAMSIGMYAIVEGKIVLPVGAKALQVATGAGPRQAATAAIRRTNAAKAVRNVATEGK